MPKVPIMLERLKINVRGIRIPNYHYTLEGILTAANSGKLVRQHEELVQHGKP